MKLKVLHVLLALVSAVTSLHAQTPAAPAAGKPLMAMLKLDDLVQQGKDPKATVSARWQKVTDFLEGEKIKASFGMLCDTLEGDCPVYVDWLKQRVSNGYIELWDHGYYARMLPPELKINGRTAENEGGTVEDQTLVFRKALDVVKQKVGVTMVAFGPHTTKVDGITYEALAGIPEIKMVWFYGPPKGQKTDKVVIQRLLELEKPLFVPNSTNLQETFLAKRATLPYVAVQGHPNQWDDARFEEFKKAVLFLRDQGCKFVTPSEYLAEIGKK